MTQLPPLPRDQRKIDADHLNLLSIFHFVGAGLALFGLMFVFVHYMMFHAIFANPEMWKNQKEAPPVELFMIFKWFYVVFAFWFVVSGVLNVISGLFMRARKHRTFSMVVAAINCLHVPLGTVLGIFTIIVLIRDSVREVYEAEPTSFRS